MRGTYTINLQNNSQVLSRRGGKTRYTALHAGQQVTVVGLYNKHTHRWSATLKIQTN